MPKSDFKTRRQIARDLSYATSASSRRGRAVIRAMEAATGKLTLMRRAKGYDGEIAAGASFWEVMADRYGLSLDLQAGSLEAVPAEGPLVLVANHPYGILDGLMMGLILSRVRDDFRIVAHDTFSRSPDLRDIILPIDFDGTRDALATNIRSRGQAVEVLGRGGAIGIFPGGTVSTAATPFARPLDPQWRSFTAQMIRRARATVVPIYFDGANSRLFQLASHLHYTLRMGLLLREFRNKIDRPVPLCVGAPIPHDDLPEGRSEIMDFLRKATYDLSSKPVPAGALGYEFEERYRGGDRNIR